ncbi:hypothetical protein PF005_g1796 [Phytophthora fragariae]|uniref:Uncharacterized protein n=1 Tax=Phytophthora fragariae TaxID=53985 RepID=A0A6A4AFI6_9STRA|nr:hypothetical protein PF003_g32332 [Phytophthora fragariae]KAE8948497.1 hypothetical protein PF009_g1922 [Phytophthora fragariae]KAE9137013.1 hypothetical protein PF007_g1956 [Phytophthora fragariae]KAE9154721.1 hypothetical protein PF006_g1255 [Phytophthora fragariae]KAE9234629.1 hypothetical protein PF005_g1796 [Phytophthora fragariae]
MLHVQAHVSVVACSALQAQLSAASLISDPGGLFRSRVCICRCCSDRLIRRSVASD